MRRRLLVAVATGGLLTLMLAAVPASQAQQATECTGTGIMSMSPGLSETPSSGTHNGREGSEQCNGPILGTQPTGDVAVDWDGRYGTADPDTCSAGGEAWVVANHHVPTKDGTKTFKNIATIEYGGVSNGAMSGTFEGDHFDGTFRIIRLIEGDCVTSPMAKFEISWTGTWH